MKSKALYKPALCQICPTGTDETGLMENRMQLQNELSSTMIEYAIPHSTYSYDIACAMLFTAWLTAMLMLSGFIMFLHATREN